MKSKDISKMELFHILLNATKDRKNLSIRLVGSSDRMYLRVNNFNISTFIKYTDKWKIILGLIDGDIEIDIPNTCTEDFINLYIERLLHYRKTRREYNNSIFSLKNMRNIDEVKEDIREKRINDIFKSENQE